jgi:predicted dehydrogenase
VSKLEFVVIGYGHIGKRHAGIIRDLGFEVRVYDKVGFEGDGPGDSGAGRAGRDLPVRIELTRDLGGHEELARGLAAAGELRGVAAICTPNYLHCGQAIEWMWKGYDVVLEKPMGLSAAACREVIGVAKELDRRVFCVMQNRYSPPSAWLKDLIGSDRMGKIYQVQINCLWNRSSAYYEQSSWKGKLREDGGTLFTQFSHFVDTLLWLFGDVRVQHARFQNFNHPYIDFEDSGFFDFEILKGGVGTFTYSTSAHGQNLESSITILAEHGSVKVGGQYMEQVLACNIDGYVMPDLLPTLPPNDYGTYKGSASNHAMVYANVLDVLAGKAEIHCTPEEGLRVVELIEEVYKNRIL